MAKPARQRETLRMRAIYRYHPLFAGADFVTYYGDDDAGHQPATVEGGDVHVIGNGTVLIGMGGAMAAIGRMDDAAALLDGAAGTTVVPVDTQKGNAST